MFDNYAILISPIRLIIFCIVFYFLNKYIIKYVKEGNIVDYVVLRWVKYSSAAILTVFVLVQLNAYDTFSLLLILFCITIYKFLNFEGTSNFSRHIKKKKNSTLLYVLKKIEQKKFSFIKYDKTSNNTNNILFYFIIITGVIVFLSRIFFYKYDLYTLSQFWFEDLKALNDLQQQQWVSVGKNMMGEYALISLFARATGINPEMAIQSFSIIESSFFAIIIYWFTTVLTKSKYIAPLVSALSFGLLFFLIPINVNFITQHNKTLLAVSMLIPFMVCFVNPNILEHKNHKSTIYLLLYFITIALIDLFATLIIFPLFLLPATIIAHKNLDFIKKTYSTYCIAVVLVLFIYWIGSYRHGYNFEEFIYSNLVSLRTIGYTPQLLFPFKKLSIVYHSISIFNLLILLFRYLKTKKINQSLFIFLIVFNLLIGLAFLTNTLDIWFIDKDLILQTMTLFLSILFGVTVSSIASLFKLFSQVESNKKYLKITSVCTITLCMLLFYTGYKVSDIKDIKAATAAKEVLHAYYTISKNFLPYSYTVVNNPKFQPVSRNKHFFTDYHDFITQYPMQDSIYFDHIDDKKYLKKNPQIILPASVLVFITKNHPIENQKPHTKEHHEHKGEKKLQQENVHNKIEQVLRKLSTKGRKIELFFDDQNFKVVEIINRPNATKINDLLF